MSSRQKSCIQCANAKRRCTPQLPRCPRCIRRGTDCSYRNVPLPTPGMTGVNSDSKSSPTQSENRSLRNYGVTKNWESGAQSDLSPLLQFDIALAPELSRPILARTDSSIISENYREYLQQAEDYPNIVKIDSWSMNTLIRNIYSWPDTFVHKLQTPFIHPSAYERSLIPPQLQEAFSACAVYIAKTEANKDVVLTVIEQAVSKLKDLDPSSMPVALHLASLQAFIILHSIQLWDGDIRQRAQAESHARLLEDWALLLHIRVMHTKDKLSESKTTWAEWIIHESARRTVILTLLAQGTYEACKYGACTYVPLMADLPFTTSDGPWNARDISEWMREIECRGTVVETYANFTISWKEHSPGQTDPFAKLLLAPCLGASYKEVLST